MLYGVTLTADVIRSSRTILIVLKTINNVVDKYGGLRMRDGLDEVELRAADGQAPEASAHGSEKASRAKPTSRPPEQLHMVYANVIRWLLWPGI